MNEENTPVETPEQIKLVSDMAKNVINKINDVAGALKETAESVEDYVEAAMAFKAEMEQAIQDMTNLLKDAIENKIKDLLGQDPPKAPTPDDIIEAITKRMNEVKDSLKDSLNNL